MKNIIHYSFSTILPFILLFGILLINTSCGKDDPPIDPCDKKACYNGGVCISGTCDCPPGYSGSNCEIKDVDPCDNITCQNGGSCVNGSCNCPPGYSGTNCQIYDPCYNVTCQNGGSCTNGDCDCPEGFYGNTCQHRKTPTAVRITKIELIEWPEYNNGFYWDTGDIRPDIFLTLQINSGTEISSGYYNQCSLANEYDYFSSIYIGSTSNKVLVRLYDWDFGSSESMGGVYFFPVDYQSSHPATKVIGNSNAKIKYRVHFDWIF